MAKFKYSANVKRLSAVSFFTDMASEMLYPIMPLLWASLGFSAQMIGMIEGIAEAVAGMSKLLWGYLADRFKKYKLLVVIGYGISAVMKPLLGVTTTYIVPLAARNIERLGKAIRTAPRDAILAAESKPEDRARVIGFHRAMDTLGAVVGPILCLILLFLLDGNLHAIFWLAAIPGVLAVIAALMINDRKVKSESKKIEKETEKKLARVPLRELKNLINFRKLVIGLGLFALVNSSDVFLILRLRDLGVTDTMIVFAYILYNAVYALMAKMSHRVVGQLGFKWSILANIVLFAVVYSLLSLELTYAMIVVVLLGYGLFAGLFEVTSKTWLSNVLPGHVRATGIGLAGSVTSLCFLGASLITGGLWLALGSANTLAILAVLSIVPLLYFSLTTIQEREEKHA